MHLKKVMDDFLYMHVAIKEKIDIERKGGMEK